MTAWQLLDNCMTSSYYWGRIIHKPWKRHRNTEMTKDRYRTMRGLQSKTFLPWWAVSKLADRAWWCQQTRISQDAYLCKMWYVKLVAQNCTYFSAAQKKLSHALSQKAKKLDLEGNKFRRFKISSCSNMILTRFSHFQCKYRLWDYILSLRYMQELTLIGMRGIHLSPSPFVSWIFRKNS